MNALGGLITPRVISLRVQVCNLNLRVYVFLGVVTVRLVIARSNPRVQIENLNPLGNPPLVPANGICKEAGCTMHDTLHILPLASRLLSLVSPPAGSSLQLEPEGLCVSGRCDCSIGYCSLKPQGSDYKCEPAVVTRLEDGRGFLRRMCH